MGAPKFFGWPRRLASSVARALQPLLTWANTLRGFGLALALHEALLTSLDRLNTLLLAAAMMGLPSFLKKDQEKGSSGS